MRPFWQASLLAGIIPLSLTSVCGGEMSGATYQPLLHDGVPAAQLRGAWQSRGYGWILELNEHGIVVHQTSAAGCSTDPRTAEYEAQFAYRQSGAAVKQLILVRYPGENRYIFDRLPSLPEPCTRTDWDAPRLFEHFVASYREQYAFFKEHHFDWEQRVRSERPLITKDTSPRVLFAIFCDLLDDLGDPHVSLNSAFRGEPVAFRTGRGATLTQLNELAARTRQTASDVKEHWLAAYNRGVREVILQSRWQETSHGKVVWGCLGEEIGYINVSSVDGFTEGSLADNIEFINELMDRILTEFAGVKAVILDLSNNTGGYDRLAREIAGHFAAERKLAYSKRAFGAAGEASDVFYAQPSPGRRFTGPTYVITSDVTGSGAEILTLTMRVLPNVTQVGTPTRGALSDRLVKVLPDGSDFSLSNEIYLDPSGKLYEAVGIPPHRTLEIFPVNDLEQGHAKAVQELVRQIRAEDSTHTIE